jgi:hypothetical protein
MSKPIEEDYSLAGELLGIEDIMYEMTAEVKMYLRKLDLPDVKMNQIYDKVREDEYGIGFSRNNAAKRIELRNEYRAYLLSRTFKLGTEIIHF